MEKICFITSEIDQMGGRQKVNAQLCNVLDETEEYDISVLFTASKSSREHLAYPLNKNIKIIDNNSIYKGKYSNIVCKLFRTINKKYFKIGNVKFLKRIYFPDSEIKAYNELLNKSEFDIIIGVGPRASAMVALTDTKAKKIGWMHTPFDLYFRTKGIFQWNQEILYKVIFKKLDKLIVLTNKDVESYFINMGIKATRIYNSLSDNEQNNNKSVPTDLLFVGRLNYDTKGLDYLIKIFERIHSKLPKAHLTIVGDGTGRMQLEKDISTYGLDDSVVLVGQKNNVTDYYSSNSILLMTSRMEGFGLVVIEAMNCGMPVVSFDTVGPSEIISDGENGFIVEMGNIEQFADRVIFLCENEIDRNMMRQKAVARATDFSVDKVLNDWRTVL